MRRELGLILLLGWLVAATPLRPGECAQASAPSGPQHSPALRLAERWSAAMRQARPLPALDRNEVAARPRAGDRLVRIESDAPAYAPVPFRFRLPPPRA